MGCTTGGIFGRGRCRQHDTGLVLLHLYVQGLNAISDLTRRHTEQARGLGLHPADLFQRSDDALAFIHIRVIDIDIIIAAVILLHGGGGLSVLQAREIDRCIIDHTFFDRQRVFPEQNQRLSI